MIPQFAVVGHPNKGKSSVVSTLARDDSIAVSMRSGTTTQANLYEVKVSDFSYHLIDTPGFQRPRKVLAWLQAKSVPTDKRADRINEFLNDQECLLEYKDEIALLTPIMQGAAILYVVDSSRPYNSDYEAEMEILRWTGQPSMALINPIVSNEYLNNWQQALQQYFRLVRVFDAVKADLEQHLELLEAFTQLHLPWAKILKHIIDSFENNIKEQQYKSCLIAADLLEELCCYRLKQKTLSKKQAEQIKPILERRYYEWMRQAESLAHDKLQILYNHHYLKRENDILELEDDLFDTDTWLAWGLNKSQLTKVAAISGAAAGGVVDLAIAGQTFMLGAVTGSIVGSTTAWFSADKLSKVKIKGLHLGGYEAKQGPIMNPNFPYVVLGRFLFINNALKHRNHALRDKLLVNDEKIGNVLVGLEKRQRKKIITALDRLVKQKEVKNLAKILEPLFVIENTNL